MIRQWQSRKFGMFIHFGLYSQFGGVFRGRPVEQGYSEQIMGVGGIPVAEYAAAAASFDPVRWDPDAVVALARAAGMKYIVLTAKHHDGFNMFATRQTTYNVVDATPYHRDVVKELATACRRAGMPFGLYYSSIDWHQPGMDRYISGNSNELSDAHAQFNAAQLRELMTHYGPISEIWFDMGKPTPEQSELFATTVHRLQPDTLVSGRVWNEQGDFTVMGDNEIPSHSIDEPWETPASMFRQTWGYRSWQKRDDLEGKIHEHILHLVEVVSGGGNYILNIGPAGDGSIVPYEANVLRGIGAYLKVNGEAIYGTHASRLGGLPFGYVTVKGRQVYLFVRDLTQPILLPRTVRTRWRRANLIGSDAHVEVHVQGKDTVVQLPSPMPAGFLPVIKVTSGNGLQVDPEVPQWGADGVLRLNEAAAQKFYNYNGRGYYAPKTVYKLRWYLPVGCSSVRFHTDGSGEVAVVSNGAARTVRISDNVEQQVKVGPDHVLELTPPEPFVKGTALPFTVQSLEARPCEGPRGSGADSLSSLAARNRGGN